MGPGEKESKLKNFKLQSHLAENNHWTTAEVNGGPQHPNQETHLPSQATQRLRTSRVISESRMRDSLRGKARNYNSQKLLRAARPPFLGGLGPRVAQRHSGILPSRERRGCIVRGIPQYRKVGTVGGCHYAPLSAQLHRCSFSPDFFTVGMCIWLLAMVLLSLTVLHSIYFAL